MEGYREREVKIERERELVEPECSTLRVHKQKQEITRIVIPSSTSPCLVYVALLKTRCFEYPYIRSDV